MGIFKKKIMYSSLPTEGDERSTYFGESSLDPDELIAPRSSTAGTCKLTVCKAVAFTLLFVGILSGIAECFLHMGSFIVEKL